MSSSASSSAIPKPYVQPGDALPEFLRRFWQRQVTTAERETPDFKHPALPLARIKKVMKSDPDVKVMIASDAPILFCKACEIFIAEMTSRAFLIADSNKRRTLSRADISRALQKSDQFDFLIDIVPREDQQQPPQPPPGPPQQGGSSGSNPQQQQEHQHQHQHSSSSSSVAANNDPHHLHPQQQQQQLTSRPSSRQHQHQHLPPSSHQHPYPQHPHPQDYSNPSTVAGENLDDESAAGGAGAGGRGGVVLQRVGVGMY